MSALWETICDHITRVAGDHVIATKQGTIAGGCISQAFRLQGNDRDYFVKLHRREQLRMFEAEARGLQAISATHTLRAPEVICSGVHADNAYLVLEHLSLGNGKSKPEILGENLAAMHRVTESVFGWDIENTIGSTPQINTFTKDWASFWNQHRLGYQLTLAEKNGFGGALKKNGERLMRSTGSILEGHTPQPSLLHGDLWSGNFSFTSDGEPVIYDPAVYYGDRETDIAMTELFGGFDKRFYAAYWNAWPMEPGYAVRETFYNLYHILNHLNLFGGGYLSQAEGMIERLLSEAR